MLVGEVEKFIRKYGNLSSRREFLSSVAKDIKENSEKHNSLSEDEINWMVREGFSVHNDLLPDHLRLVLVEQKQTPYGQYKKFFQIVSKI